MSTQEFLDRVWQHMPKNPPKSYFFEAWRYQDKPTSEGLGLLPAPGVNVDKLIACILDVDHYVGNVEHVVECRTVADPRFTPPQQLRMYEKINVPMISKLQMELVLTDAGERDGFRLIYWEQLNPESMRLDPKAAARSEFNVGAWIAKPGLVGYALSSSPVRDDVGLLKFKAMTKGADAIAQRVFKSNMEGMLAWSRRV